MPVDDKPANKHKSAPKEKINCRHSPKYTKSIDPIHRDNMKPVRVQTKVPQHESHRRHSPSKERKDQQKSRSRKHFEPTVATFTTEVNRPIPTR